MIKRNLIITCVVVIMALIICIIGKQKFHDSGLLEADTTEDLMNINVDFPYISIEEDYSFSDGSKQSYLNNLEQFSYIAVVRPTGHIQNVGDILRMQVSVKEVIKGNIDRKNIYIQSGGNFRYFQQHISVENEDGTETEIVSEPKVFYMNDSNIMFKDYDYLVFFNDIELKELDDTNSIYEANDCFCWNKISSDRCDKTVDINTDSIKFCELTEYDYFTSSKKVLNYLYDVKDLVIDKYYTNRN